MLTERLSLRQWRDDDRAPFAALNADPLVMEHFPAPLTAEQSDAMVDRLAAGIAERGWGMFAVEVVEGPDVGRFAGFVGIQPLTPDLPPAPGTEIGWRLAAWAWGRGYATEAGRACLQHAFTELALPEVVAFTAVPNLRSQDVMRRLGMTHRPARDFDHPRVPAGHRLSRHVLFALERP
ncbi:GNAT family N-acetyltransferase [Motilibacter rhizosphaerae]|uniref:GNAT family N-acetyltransferase n=1 Tax=Motilibacter rhizosphaerae TaxID=598652 RepID=UPI00102B2770